MPRSKNSVASRRRKKNLLAAAKGYWGRRSKIYTVAKHTVDRAMRYAYRDRRQRKRQFRRLWIARINAGARLNGTSYSKLMGKLNRSEVALNRKALADLAMHDPAAFKKVVDHVAS